MAIVKVYGKKKKKDLQNNYKNKDALENVIHYINRENEGGKEELVAELCGGYGVDMSSSETIIRDMRRIKTIYGKEEVILSILVDTFFSRDITDYAASFKVS